MLEFYPGQPKPKPVSPPIKALAIAAAIMAMTPRARADTMRLKVRPSSGELVPFGKSHGNQCGKDGVQPLWRVVFKRLLVQIVDGELGILSGDEFRVADRSGVNGDVVFGVFSSLSETRAFTISVDRAAGGNPALRATKISITVRSAIDPTRTCTETWLGSSEVL